MKSGIKCDICGGKALLVHRGTRDNPHIDVYECQNCHTRQLGEIRENDYEHGFMNEKARMSDEEIADRIQECRADDVRRANMVSQWCKKKDVLDFGCGFGGFMEAISGVAKSVSGVELSLTERTYLQEKSYQVRGRLDDFPEKFDVITLFHVFEHLKNPRGWMKDFCAYLNDGGRLFIEVPNANDALLSLYENDAFADFTYWSAHLYLYTKESLTRIIEEAVGDEMVIEEAGQVQRYPLPNHLYWLAKGKPGGQNVWQFLYSEKMEKEYEAILEAHHLCDTLFFRLRKRQPA